MTLPAHWPVHWNEVHKPIVHFTDMDLVGRGVFAGRDIPGRTVIEISPVLVLDPMENEEHVQKTDLYNYT